MDDIKKEDAKKSTYQKNKELMRYLDKMAREKQ